MSSWPRRCLALSLTVVGWSASAAAAEQADAGAGVAAAVPAAPLTEADANDPAAPLTEAGANEPLDGSRITGEGRVLRPYVRQLPAEEAEPRAAEPSRGAPPRDLPFRHDAFYLRFALGLGLLYDRLRGDWEGYALPAEGGRRGGLSALAGASELAVGWTLPGGIALGLGLFTLLAPSPRAETRDASRYEFDVYQLALVGPMADFYPWPTRGWHAGLALGVAALTVGDAPSPDPAARAIEDHVALGPGFALALGHEWWLGERWSCGMILRWTQGWGAGKGADGSRFVHREGGVAAFAGLTFH